MDPIYDDVATLLLQLELELRRLRLWEDEAPPAEALASTEPFCVDTLSLPQWLQFVFLPRMAELVEGSRPLPDKCGIAPIAEEYFRGGDYTAGALIHLLAAIDERLQRG
ncbi:YqcC family protein [Microbulbifer magnicolonia]|uniref:YqcC family protein n=1 Tax=Microbulbifer magnicolonia TaxID=3109744 RepID=UPI002B411509|nr:YqcC family protein [Microbulbifer sp. GG15]